MSQIVPASSPDVTESPLLVMCAEYEVIARNVGEFTAVTTYTGESRSFLGFFVLLVEEFKN